MSDETRAKLEAAIQEHLTDECEVTLTDWFMAASGTSIEMMDAGRTRYIFVAGDTTPFHSTVGLIHYAMMQVKEQSEDDS